jgi:hypothetical protein
LRIEWAAPNPLTWPSTGALPAERDSTYLRIGE